MTPSLPSHGTYVSAQGRARATTILLIAGTVINGLLIVAEIIQLAFPPFRQGDQASDNAGGLLGLLLYSLLTILALHRVCRDCSRFPHVVAPRFK